MPVDAEGQRRVAPAVRGPTLRGGLGVRAGQDGLRAPEVHVDRALAKSRHQDGAPELWRESCEDAVWRLSCLQPRCGRVLTWWWWRDGTRPLGGKIRQPWLNFTRSWQWRATGLGGRFSSRDCSFSRRTQHTTKFVAQRCRLVANGHHRG
jgi:hypothetical protein